MSTLKELCEEKGVVFEHVANQEMPMHMGRELPYASCLADFLDRDTMAERRSIFYPITRICLMNKMSEENREGHPHRVFIVNADGQWVEEAQG